jgi:hypothetical protein
MKQVQNETLGFKLNVQVPDSVEEFDRMAGRSGAALDEANKNVMYRGWNADFRRTFVEVLGKQFPDIKRAVVGKGPKTKKNPEGSDVYESEQKYLDRVLAGGHSLVELQPLAEQTAAQIPFDPSAAERSTKVGKEYLELADGVIAKGNDAVEKATAKLLGLNATFGDVERYAAGDEIPTGAAEGQVTRESLAALIRANTLRKAQEDLV